MAVAHIKTRQQGTVLYVKSSSNLQNRTWSVCTISQRGMKSLLWDSKLLLGLSSCAIIEGLHCHRDYTRHLVFSLETEPDGRIECRGFTWKVQAH